MSLSDLRKQIDGLDKEISSLLEKRMELSGAVAEEKAKTGAPILNKNRENEILARIENVYIAKIYEEIFKQSRSYQRFLMGEKFGLIGEKLSHSFSKIIHEKLSSDVYSLIELPENEVIPFLKKADFRGINVTIPYKKTVMPALFEVSKTAKAVGSVNTIVNKDGKLFGYNTDVSGFLYMIKRAGIELSGKKVLILGSGGTSLTAQYVCKSEKAREVVVISRHGEDNYQNTEKHFDADVIINTTPVGMFPNVTEKPLDLANFGKLSGVVDVIYNPSVTELVFDAKRLGIKATTGLPMLIYQAIMSHDLFYGENTPPEKCEKIIKEIELETKNIVLIGMPGCGKSTIGKRLSEVLGRQFLDSDEYIKLQKNAEIEALFEAFGEEGFRDIECDVLLSLGKLSGKIIATGGGSVIREENFKNLKRNSIVIYITRDISLLETAGRPLSKDASALKRLYSERCEKYEKFADFVVSNDGDAEDIVTKILQNCYKA